MDEFGDILARPNIHHAYIIESIEEQALELLARLIESKRKIKRLANPDFVVLSHDTFGIDESHALIALQSKTSESGTRYILVSAGKITPEAQNALLKVFEEPNLGTHFFIILPTLNNILPTLRSRVHTHSFGKGHTVDATKFMSLTIPERISWLEDVLVHPEDDRERTQKQAIVLDILAGLEFLVQNLETNKKVMAVEALIEARRYINDPAVSYKLILTNLALNLPVV